MDLLDVDDVFYYITDTESGERNLIRKISSSTRDVMVGLGK